MQSKLIRGIKYIKIKSLNFNPRKDKMWATTLLQAKAAKLSFEILKEKDKWGLWIQDKEKAYW